MNKIEDCTSIEELRQFPMTDLTALYSKMTKTHAPKFSDKGAAAKRILPMLQQKQREKNALVFTDPPKNVGKLIKVAGDKKVRGRPAGQLDDRVYVFNYSRFNEKYKQLAPQARMILRSLEDRGINNLSESELKTQIQVKTKQDPWRIFQYYRPKMISYGIIKLENQHEKAA